MHRQTLVGESFLLSAKLKATKATNQQVKVAKVTKEEEIEYKKKIRLLLLVA